MINKSKDINEWTRKEFENLPVRKYGEDIGEFDALVIIPSNFSEGTNNRYMFFIAIKNGVPFCKFGGSSDKLWIDGIGGYGYFKDNLPQFIEPKAWRIICLKKSRLLMLFCERKITADRDLSPMEIYASNKIKS